MVSSSIVNEKEGPIYLSQSRLMDLTIVLIGSTRFPTKPFFPSWSNAYVTDLIP